MDRMNDAKACEGWTTRLTTPDDGGAPSPMTSFSCPKMAELVAFGRPADVSSFMKPTTIYQVNGAYNNGEVDVTEEFRRNGVERDMNYDCWSSNENCDRTAALAAARHRYFDNRPRTSIDAVRGAAIFSGQQQQQQQLSSLPPDRGRWPSRAINTGPRLVYVLTQSPCVDRCLPKMQELSWSKVKGTSLLPRPPPPPPPPDRASCAWATCASTFDLVDPVDSSEAEYPNTRETCNDARDVNYKNSTTTSGTRRHRRVGQCVFCRNNGASRLYYESHVVKDRFGRVTCPVLRHYQCPICLASGDEAHTIRYCPRNKHRDRATVSNLIRSFDGLLVDGKPKSARNGQRRNDTK